ncbi:unnamed protein product, partial [Rotaria magnacalcarata]
MKNTMKTINVPGRANPFTYFHPNQEKPIQTISHISSGHMLFLPADALKSKGLVTPHAIVPV